MSFKKVGVTAELPGTPAWTTAVFDSKEVPAGTEVFIVQPSPAGQDAAVEAMADSLYCAETSATMEQAREQARLLLAAALPHLSARQPVGQGQCAIELTCNHDGWQMEPWNAFGLPTVGKKVTVYVASPSQAVDLEQFLKLAQEVRVTADDWTSRGVAGNAVLRNIADRLLALINSQKA